MATEDLLTYTEVDVNGRLAVTADRVTWASLGDDETAYLYQDKGVDFFDGDFEHWCTVQISTSNTNTWKAGWLLANAVDDLNQLDIAGEETYALMLKTSGAGAGTPKLHLLASAYGGSETTVNYDTPYYLKIRRDESVGTYGTLYLDIYTDAARTNLLASTSIALPSKLDFRYVYAMNSRNDGSTQEQSGYLEDLILTFGYTQAFIIG